MLTIKTYFQLTNSHFLNLFKEDDQVWEPLVNLKPYMDKQKYPALSHCLLKNGIPLPEHLILYKNELFIADDYQISFGDACKGKLKISKNNVNLDGASLIMAGSILIGDQIAIGEGCLIESGAMIKSPAIIGDNCEVRQGAYLRGYCLAGNRCVLGHTTEIKHSILLDDAKAGHFAYLGDSIMGNNTNLGAGTKFANLKFISGNVTINDGETSHDTGLRKLGAILGDNTQTGCNSVTNPGTIFGKDCVLMPNKTSKAGVYPSSSIVR
ncbi:MAG: hypothetical protein OCC45_15000 [Desulfotalea sp.]